MPSEPSREDTWVALLARDPVVAARALKPTLDRVRLRRRIHEEGLEAAARSAGIAERIALREAQKKT